METPTVAPQGIESMTDPAMLPGLDRVGVAPVGPAITGAVPSGPSWEPAGAWRLIAATGDGADLEAAVGALEQVRRVEAWLTWHKHRLVLDVVRASRDRQTRWVDSHPAFDDAEGGIPGYVQAGPRGLSRRERLAVGERSGVAEAAAVLRVGEEAVHGLLRRAEALTGLLPATVEAMASGEITGSAGSLVAGEVREYADLLASTGTDEATVRALEDAVAMTEADLLSGARAGRSTGWLRDRAVKVRERCHPSTFEQRHAAAVAERCVRVSRLPDGMARLSAVLPAAVAHRIDGRLSRLAREVTGEGREHHGGDAPRRTVAQLRADVLADLLGGLDGSTLDAGFAVAARSRGSSCRDGDPPPPAVLLTLPAETVLGGADPGWISGFGPIAAEDARRLALLATSVSLAVTAAGSNGRLGGPPGPGGDPPWPPWPPPVVVPVVVTGERQYRVPAALRRALVVRDGTCRFPGCRRSAMRCDVDHVVAWADGGSTVPENLAHLCRKHHVLKHHSAWTVRSEGGPDATRDTTPRAAMSGRADPDAGSLLPDASVLAWTSPAGRRYLSPADDPAPF
ncbi:hypothetical protein GCM10011512_20440 [Tersicoccus solisilvae]|uniref:HNH nuclease domain-containing protein n=1 Tax=Tersicoccus solisilvae TaxID=1882339 RepID=A0ABQ1P8K1_9MICC|nr:HNH endonuclease signature motif containing protein [Tersicoccus solisilvae]GGC93316.1 hypothetical protein GCM10011512_20440 [Tersicoccus solisilvae]